MRQAKRWRYYCDHCRKSSGSKTCMDKHERGCTANPSRVCGMCAVSGGSAVPTAELVAELQANGYKALQSMAENCPACMLAAMRQAKWPDWDQASDPFEGQEPFDFKKRAGSTLTKTGAHTSRARGLTTPPRRDPIAESFTAPSQPLPAPLRPGAFYSRGWKCRYHH